MAFMLPESSLPEAHLRLQAVDPARNVARDARHQEALAAQGWRSLVVWECAVKDREVLEKRLRDFMA